jgi:hypothetical protein
MRIHLLICTPDETCRDKALFQAKGGGVPAGRAGPYSALAGAAARCCRRRRPRPPPARRSSPPVCGAFGPRAGGQSAASLRAADLEERRAVHGGGGCAYGGRRAMPLFGAPTLMRTVVLCVLPPMILTPVLLLASRCSSCSVADTGTRRERTCSLFYCLMLRQQPLRRYLYLTL